ncbi:SCO6880 family protein (plasmid) [Sphaerimonospora sp. CA-214678]|uniref:SCO6880 family protein n=1 Tax=Sphaerimonospora sp. CA-214678 TaxID=3240029 RepID=UPI003D8A1C00
MSPQTEPRTYGGWRRRRGIGLFGMGVGVTFALLGVVVALLVAAAVSPRALVYLVPPLLMAALLGLAPAGATPLAGVLLVRWRWWYGTRRDLTRFRSEPHLELPGVLAPTVPLSMMDGYGRPYGLVWDRRTGHLTATLRVVATSPWLADRDDADTWVACWGGWLASLGHVPTVRWVSVTVETAPEPGSRLADTIAASVDPASPDAARAILAQLVASAPAAAAHVDTRVSITFDPKASPLALSTLAEAAAEVSRTLEGLESALGSCGVTVLGRASAAEIAGMVRTAFDPSARGEVSRALAHPVEGEWPSGWADAVPLSAEELPGCYRHDSGVSVAWSWQEAPRQNVHADVLARLIAPGPYPKRVTLQYRPFPASAAGRVLESEVTSAAFRQAYRRRTGRDETARDAFDQARARQAASEEAIGAGVCLAAMFVTVTVLDAADLPQAIATTEAAAESSKIRLRLLTGSQAAGFAATLPCGICPPALARR